MKFIDEINQQPDALLDLKRIYNESYPPAIALTDTIKKRDYREFVFTGMGSSYFVGHIACALLRSKGIKANAYESKEFAAYGIGAIDTGSLAVAISQSGESNELIDLLAAMPQTDNVIAISNNENSSLCRYCKIKFLLYAGKEYTTSTKTYTNTIAAILYISNVILKSRGLPELDFAKLTDKCVEIMKDCINAGAEKTADFFENARYICLVGGGPSYCTASHSELVVEEAGKMFSTRYLPAQFLHGPVELIDENFNILAFDFSEHTRGEIDRVIDNALSYGGKICVITNRDIDISHNRFMSVKLDMQNEFYSPLVEVLPLELFINEIALRRGLNPGILERVRK